MKINALKIINASFINSVQAHVFNGLFANIILNWNSVSKCDQIHIVIKEEIFSWWYMNFTAEILELVSL